MEKRFLTTWPGMVQRSSGWIWAVHEMMHVHRNWKIHVMSSMRELPTSQRREKDEIVGQQKAKLHIRTYEPKLYGAYAAFDSYITIVLNVWEEVKGQCSSSRDYFGLWNFQSTSNYAETWKRYACMAQQCIGNRVCVTLSPQFKKDRVRLFSYAADIMQEDHSNWFWFFDPDKVVTVSVRAYRSTNFLYKNSKVVTIKVQYKKQFSLLGLVNLNSNRAIYPSSV